MSTSVKSDQQHSTLHPEGTVGIVAWSVGGERRTASFRIVRHDTTEPPRPTDMPMFTQALTLPQPTRLSNRRGRRPSATRTRPVREAA